MDEALSWADFLKYLVSLPSAWPNGFPWSLLRIELLTRISNVGAWGDLVDPIHHPVGQATIDVSTSSAHWLLVCRAAARGWAASLREDIDVHRQFPLETEQTKMFFQKTGTLFANAGALLDAHPSDMSESAADDEALMQIVRRSLLNLAEISTAIQRNDYTWLKAIIDETERRHRESPRRPESSAASGAEG